jgi:hypothetical protein
VPGAQPQHLIASSYINGCSALALGGSDPCVAALDAHDNPIVSKALTSTRHPIRRSFFRAGVTSA